MRRGAIAVAVAGGVFVVGSMATSAYTWHNGGWVVIVALALIAGALSLAITQPRRTQ